MTSIDDLEKIYLESFKDTFDKLDLQRYETSGGLGRGGWIKFKNSAFRLQLIDDSGLIEMDISPLHGEEQFRGVELYNSLLTLKTANDNLSKLDRRRIIGTRLDYESQSKFLLNQFDLLKALLDRNNYKTTLRDIHTLGQER